MIINYDVSQGIEIKYYRQNNNEQGTYVKRLFKTVICTLA